MWFFTPTSYFGRGRKVLVTHPFLVTWTRYVSPPISSNLGSHSAKATHGSVVPLEKVLPATGYSTRVGRWPWPGRLGWKPGPGWTVGPGVWLMSRVMPGWFDVGSGLPGGAGTVEWIWTLSWARRSDGVVAFRCRTDFDDYGCTAADFLLSSSTVGGHGSWAWIWTGSEHRLVARGWRSE